MATKKQVQEAPLFEKAELIKAAKRLFDVVPEMAAGALYDIKEPITLDQAQDLIDEFKTRPIKTNRRG